MQHTQKNVMYHVGDVQGHYGSFATLEEACLKAKYLSSYSTSIYIDRVVTERVDLTYINGELT